MGGKSSNEIIELLSASDIFIFTSVPEYHGHSTETQGLATLEAMACQLPVVAFDTGGVKYTFEDEVSGFVCDEYDTDCVFNKVRYLIENRTILKDMGEAARAFVIQNYSQKEIDKKWKIIYGNLSNG